MPNNSLELTRLAGANLKLVFPMQLPYNEVSAARPAWPLSSRPLGNISIGNL